MTEAVATPAAGVAETERRRAASIHQTPEAEARRQARYRAERRFRWYGIFGIGAALGMLCVLLFSIGRESIPAFTQTFVTLDIHIDPELVYPQGEPDPEALGRANYQTLANEALYEMFPDVEERRERSDLRGLLSPGVGFELRQRVLDDPSLVGETVTVTVEMSDDYDQLNKGLMDRTLPEDQRRLKDHQVDWFESLEEQGLVETQFNWRFFTGANSRYPELAGIWAALIGSALTMIVTLGLAFPLAVATAVYLEEFAPKNRFTDLIEVNINNLAAVPSIVFGLLGLAVFIQFFGMPNSTPVVGGMVIALMTLPTIIIASRAAIKAVPPSIREAALGVGASKTQVVTHHVLPLAMPGILTGTIIGMAQALGETAPLLMVGMVIFITSVPGGFTDPATVLPVQIYSWAGNPERGFVALTSAAIMVLLTFLIAMNAIAVLLRRRFERRW
jgi:phosphate transport system permease protein